MNGVDVTPGLGDKSSLLHNSDTAQVRGSKGGQIYQVRRSVILENKYLLYQILVESQPNSSSVSKEAKSAFGCAKQGPLRIKVSFVFHNSVMAPTIVLAFRKRVLKKNEEDSEKNTLA